MDRAGEIADVDVARGVDGDAAGFVEFTFFGVAQLADEFARRSEDVDDPGGRLGDVDVTVGGATGAVDGYLNFSRAAERKSGVRFVEVA